MDKGLEILLNAFWKDGWRFGEYTPEEFEIAKREGYMFDYPKVISHNEVLSELQDVLAQITPEMVANAFLYSLSTRKLEYRSALGSYWYAIAIPKHSSTDEQLCNCCGWYKLDENPDDYELRHGLNVLNFERYKWGGVRHTNLDYALFDLQQFLKLPIHEHTNEDEEILNNILLCVRELEPKNKSRALQKMITQKKLLKSNKSEVDILLDILGICGVLSSDENPCYVVSFRDKSQRDPFDPKNDFVYPVNRWRVSDGINQERYNEVFGKVISQGEK